MSRPLAHELKWLDVCAYSGSVFSSCSRRQYFAVVLSADRRVVGTGYNGAPPGLVHCVDGGCPRGLTVAGEVGHGAPYGNCVAIHAEANALLYSDRTARLGGTIIINGPPCFDCSKLIAGSGLRRLVHSTDSHYADWPKCKDLLAKSGVKVVSVVSATDTKAEVNIKLKGIHTIESDLL